VTRTPTQRERIASIIRDIETTIGRKFDGPGDEDLDLLVDACLEGPLSDTYEDADTDVCEVLLYLGCLTGDE
jgi:hypothetical protein